MTIQAPTGMKLSVATGAKANVTFIGGNVSSANNALPLQQAANGIDLVTNGTAVFAPCTSADPVLMQFPPLTLTPTSAVSKTRADASGTITITGLTIKFIVTGASWTLPSSYTLNFSPKDGKFVLGNSVCTLQWNKSSMAPQSASLLLPLYLNGSQISSATKTSNLSGGDMIIFSGSNTTVEFNEIGSATEPAVLDLSN